jgi:tetratricopeptide (TPR) repeat protein
MRKRKPAINRANGIIILKRSGEQDWFFEYPRITSEVHEALGEAIDWMNCHYGTAKARLRKIIKDYPEHLDARHHLALCWSRQGKLEKAAQLWKETLEFALKLFPADFSLKRARLAWGYLENRPFLRLYHSHGISLMKLHQTEEALEVFNNLVSLNPHDNQGARALVVLCNFELRQPDGVLAICDKFPNDTTEELAYGRALALLQVGRAKEASAALRGALRFLPLVGHELVKAAHKQPKDYDEKRVVYNSPGQAYGYWEKFGKFWSATPGAVGFVRTHLKAAVDEATDAP